MELTDLRTLIPDLVIDLRYGTTNNVTGKILYEDVQPCLVPAAAEALVQAAEQLRLEGYRIVVWDAYRPEAAQAALRQANDDERYVLEVSNHSKGLAVDVTLIDEVGNYVDMGTDYDDFSERAHVGAKQITRRQARNRAILSGSLVAAGFKEWPYEWWHFDFLAID